MLNNIVWPTALIGVNAHVLPALGMPADYGIFTCISILIIMASFMTWGTGNTFVSDLEGARSISYDLTLPVPYWMVYMKNMLHFSTKSALYSLSSLLVGKIILFSSFNFSQTSISAFLLIYLAANLFFGAFTLWGAILAGTTQRYTNIELRIAGPLFFVCGFSSSWNVLHTVAPTLAKFMLATPWIYAYEGTRAAILGPSNYLPVTLCAGMLILFTILFTIHGMWLFKRKLDCV